MTKIWAHRGASAYAPENTLEAFQLAIDMHSDGIELDVHLTSDGELVVIHDNIIERTSNGIGKVSDMSLNELRKYNFAGAFSDKYTNIKLPTLEEVFDLVYNSGISINVELKASGKEFIRKTCECAKKMNIADRVIYSSFDHFNLIDILEVESNAIVAPLYSFNMVKPWLYCDSFKAKALHPHVGQVLAVKDYVEKSHELGIKVHTWTVDDKDTIEKIIALGVDAIITNKPDYALSILNGKEGN